MHNPHSTAARAVAISCIAAPAVAHMAIRIQAAPAACYFFLLLLLMGAAQTAAAQGLSTLRLQPANEKQFWVNMGGASQHFKNAHRFNQQNSGLGIEYALDNDRSLVIGEYLNSVRGTTRYIGGAWTPVGYGPFRFGALAGFADGYPKMRGGGFFPIALPVMTVETRYVGVNFMVMPSIAAKVSGCVAMQLKFRFQ